MADPSFRSRVLSGEPLLGCFLTWPVQGVPEVLALANFDFVVLDAEHGFFSIESIESMVRACDSVGLPSIVRVPSCPAAETGRSLDAGASGVLFPRAENAESARLGLETAKYAPLGKRGLAGVRANRYGTVPLGEFVVSANATTMVVVQIETAGALRDVEAVARLEGCDVLYVGPNDLTFALGIPGRYTDSRYQQAIARVADAAKKAGKAAGIMLARADQIPPLREMGFSFFTMSDRLLILESARQWRGAIPRRVPSDALKIEA
ncbi:MAG: aldolase/citrate lyase family protein [Acidobacteriota bacterium]